MGFLTITVSFIAGVVCTGAGYYYYNRKIKTQPEKEDNGKENGKKENMSVFDAMFGFMGLLFLLVFLDKK